MEFTELTEQWAALLGLAAVIAVVINLLKVAGLVKDGQAPTWSAGLNLLGLVLLLVLRVFKPEVNIGEVDRQAGALAQVGLVLVGYITQLLAAKVTHEAVKSVPVIGTSYSEPGMPEEKPEDWQHREQMIHRNPRVNR